MKRVSILVAASLLATTASFAQTTITTTTGVGAGAVVIEPAQRTRIKQYITTHQVRPVTVQERFVVGATVPEAVELAAVPAEWGPTVTQYRYVYYGDNVALVDPSTRRVVQIID